MSLHKVYYKEEKKFYINKLKYKIYLYKIKLFNSYIRL